MRGVACACLSAHSSRRSSWFTHASGSRNSRHLLSWVCDPILLERLQRSEGNPVADKGSRNGGSRVGCSRPGAAWKHALIQQERVLPRQRRRRSRIEAARSRLTAVASRLQRPGFASREREGGGWHAVWAPGLYGRPGDSADQVIAKEGVGRPCELGQVVWDEYRMPSQSSTFRTSGGAVNGEGVFGGGRGGGEARRGAGRHRTVARTRLSASRLDRGRARLRSSFGVERSLPLGDRRESRAPAHRPFPRPRGLRGGGSGPS